MKNLIDTLKKLPVDDRMIILSDLAEIKHNYSVKESLNAYRNLRSIFEQSDFMNLSQNHRKLFSICEDNLFMLRRKLCCEAMVPLNEDISDEDEDEDEQEQKERERDKEEQERKNIEKFEKEAEKSKKDEQAPLAKALRGKGDNQDDAAELLDVHKSTISRWKTGTRNPNFDNLQDLKNKYGASVVNQILSDE